MFIYATYGKACNAQGSLPCPTFQISDIVTESFDCTKLQSTANGTERDLAIKISQKGERQAKIK